MLQIKVILRNRIKDINHYSNVESQLLQTDGTEDLSEQIEQTKVYETKKLERSRCQKQAKLLMSLNQVMLSNNKQVEEFYHHSVDIFCQFDSYFQKFKNKIQLFSISMQQNLRILYSMFFNKYAQQQFQLSQSLMSDVSALSPSFFLGLIRKWSKSLLQAKLKAILSFKLAKEKENDNLRSSINKQTFKQEINSDILSKNLIVFKKQPQTIKRSIFTTVAQTHEIMQKNNLGHNKENVYAYCLQQMRQYYKSMPIQDLDYNYLKSFKKSGKKQQLFSKANQKQVITILVHRQNKQIIDAIQQFSQQFQKHFKKKCVSKQNIKQNNSQLNLSQIPKQSNLRNIFLNKSYNYKNTQSQLLSSKNSVDNIINSLSKVKSKQLQIKIHKLKNMVVKNQKFNIEFPPINPQKHHHEKQFQKKKFSFLQDQYFQLEGAIKGAKRQQKHQKTSFSKSKKRQQQSSAFGLKCSGINNEVHQRRQMFKIDRGLFYKQQIIKTNQNIQSKPREQSEQTQVKQNGTKKLVDRNKYLKQSLQMERQKQLQTQKQIIDLITKQKLNKLSPIKKQYKGISKKSIRNQILQNEPQKQGFQSHVNLSKKANVAYIQEYRNQKKLLKLLVYQNH